MNSWQTMFRGVQAITRSANSLEEGVRMTVELARSHPAICGDSAYWNRVESHDFSPALAVVAGWAEEGLRRLETTENWDFVAADLGDCPESFRLDSSSCHPSLGEQKFRHLVLAQSVIEFGAFSDRPDSDQTDAEPILYPEKR